jgi:hypothetical protein
LVAPAARQLPRNVVKPVADQTRDVGRKFASAEIKRQKTGMVIVIDRFLAERGTNILQDIKRQPTGALRLVANAVSAMRGAI